MLGLIRFVLILILLLLLYYGAARLWRRWVGRTPRELWRTLIQFGVLGWWLRRSGGTAALLAGLIRYLPQLQALWLRWQADQTAWLRLFSETPGGALDGIVLHGRYAGRTLSRLNRDELLNLHAELRQADAVSMALLEGYLNRRYGADWRRADPRQQQPPPNNRPDGKMTREEALAVLGLNSHASEQEILSAHRRLMLKFHPDRGGSDYLAAKVNLAKRVLLKK